VQLLKYILDEFEQSEHIPKHTFGISAKVSFIFFLWFMSNTEPLRTMSDISISSVFRILRRVQNWLLTKLDDTIRWP